MKHPSRWVSAYAPRDAAELALIRSLLDDAGFEYTVSSEHYASLGGGLAFLGDIGVDLLVHPDEVPPVRKLLMDAGIIRVND